MKLLFISDIHAGNQGKNLRLASGTAIEKLESLLPILEKEKSDFIFQTGDTVKETNPDLYSKIQDLLNQIGPKVINIPGNHDIQANILQPISYGEVLFENFQLIWLGLDLDKEKNIGTLPQNQLAWLEKELDKSKQTILISHYGIFPPEQKGSRYFDNPNSMYYFNSKEILLALKDKNIILNISSHLHWTGIIENSFRQISMPSFSENTLGGDFNPGIYSTLETIDSKLVFKSWSDGSCIFDYEFNLF